MPEQLCTDCVLQGNEKYIPADVPMNPQNLADQDRILKLSDGVQLLNALKLPRPKRCKALHKLLPPPTRFSPNRVVSPNRCPELGLIALAYSDIDDIAKVTY